MSLYSRVTILVIQYINIYAVDKRSMDPTLIEQSPVEDPQILCPPDVKSQLIGNDHDAGKDWGQEKKRAVEDEIGWHHWLNWNEFDKTPGTVKDREAWRAEVHGGHKKLDTT